MVTSHNGPSKAIVNTFFQVLLGENTLQTHFHIDNILVQQVPTTHLFNFKSSFDFPFKITHMLPLLLWGQHNGSAIDILATQKCPKNLVLTWKSSADRALVIYVHRGGDHVVAASIQTTQNLRQHGFQNIRRE